MHKIDDCVDVSCIETGNVVLKNEEINVLYLFNETYGGLIFDDKREGVVFVVISMLVIAVLYPTNINSSKY